MMQILIQIPTGTDDVNFTDDITLKSDSAVLGFGADTDITLTHANNTGLTFNNELYYPLVLHQPHLEHLTLHLV